jgi:alanine dehydrogenase
MLIGVPKEIKDNEFRVGLTPASVAELIHHGHKAIVEAGAGAGSGLSDDEYARAGAEIVAEAAEVFARADMIVKVKEPLAVAPARSCSPTCISPRTFRRRAI